MRKPQTKNENVINDGRRPGPLETAPHTLDTAHRSQDPEDLTGQRDVSQNMSQN